MTLLIQALPLLALVAVLASGRAGAVTACAVAIALTLPAVLLHPHPPTLAAFAGGSVVQGLWLAVIPVGIIVGGLVFHAAVAGEHARPDAPAEAATGTVPDQLFTAAFLLGPFTETVTGFGVGTVFAIGMIRRTGITGVQAAVIGLIAQTMIPWGGLGPGTAVGAALADIPPQELASRSAWLTAAMLLLLLPLFWHWCRQAGHPVAPRQRLTQTGWVLATGAMLILWHHAAPWEVCGLLATGIALAARLLHAHPPRTGADRARAARAAFPYMLLALALLGSRIWQHPPSLHPFPDLPALPANHAMVALWLVALTLLATRHGSAAPQIVRAALRRGRAPAAALLMFVVLSRFLSNADIPQTLAMAMSAGLGHGAPFAAPLLAGFAGFFAGTNVGANSAMMPLQAALGSVAGLGRAVLPAVQNGTSFLLLSPQITTIAAALAGDGASPARIWRRAWPVALITLAVAMASIVIG